MDSPLDSFIDATAPTNRLMVGGYIWYTFPLTKTLSWSIPSIALDTNFTPSMDRKMGAE